MLEYVLGSNGKGDCGLSRSIHGPCLVARGSLNPDAKIPTRLALYSLVSMNAAAQTCTLRMDQVSLVSLRPSGFEGVRNACRQAESGSSIQARAHDSWPDPNGGP